LDLVLFGLELTDLVAQQCIPLLDSLGADGPRRLRQTFAGECYRRRNHRDAGKDQNLVHGCPRTDASPPRVASNRIAMGVRGNIVAEGLSCSEIPVMMLTCNTQPYAFRNSLPAARLALQAGTGSLQGSANPRCRRHGVAPSQSLAVPDTYGIAGMRFAAASASHRTLPGRALAGPVMAARAGEIELNRSKGAQSRRAPDRSGRGHA